MSLRSQTSTVKGDQAGVGYSNTFFALEYYEYLLLSKPRLPAAETTRRGTGYEE